MANPNHVQTIQMDLFLPRPILPRWAQLPAEIQNKTRELLVQFLNESLAECASESSKKEVSYE